MNYKVKENDFEDRKKETISYREDQKEEQVEPEGVLEEIAILPVDDVKFHLDLISNLNTNIDKLLESLFIIAQQSGFSEVSLFLFNNECYNSLYQHLSELEKFSNPLIIFHFLNIMNNILSLPGEVLTTIFLSDFPVLFKDIVNYYSNGPPEVVSTIFDIFLTIIRPPITISFIDYYIPFFAIYLKYHNPCEEPQLTFKSFQCCNKMFDIEHDGLQAEMLKNKFLDDCYIHINRKTPSFFEAFQLVGHICYYNSNSIAYLNDNFFTDLVPDLLKDTDDSIIATTLRVLEALSSNESIIEIIINENKIFKRILKMYDRSLEVKIRSIELLTTIIESEKPMLEIRFIDYGTLDFFAEYIFSEDADVRKKVLAALDYLIIDFIDKQTYSAMPPPFVSVLENSGTLIKSLYDLLFEEDLLDEIQEASIKVLNSFKRILGESAINGIVGLEIPEENLENVEGSLEI